MLPIKITVPEWGGNYGGIKMQLTINGTDYNFKFGIGFLRELDKKHGMEKDGMKLGMGLQMTVTQVLNGDILMMIDYLMAANHYEKNNIAQRDLENYIENLDDLDNLQNQLSEELINSSVTKSKTKAAKSQLEKAAKKNK